MAKSITDDGYEEFYVGARRYRNPAIVRYEDGKVVEVINCVDNPDGTQTLVPCIDGEIASEHWYHNGEFYDGVALGDDGRPVPSTVSWTEIMAGYLK